MTVQRDRLPPAEMWLTRAGIGLWTLMLAVVAISGIWTWRESVGLPQSAAIPTSPQPARTQRSTAQLPLAFTPNAGQTDPAVRFTVKGAGHTIFFTPSEVVFSAIGQTGEESVASVVRLRFAGANPDLRIEGLDQLPGIANFFLGSDPSQWRTGVPTFAAVAYRELYPGIDLVYRGTEGRLKSEFLVAPKADPGMIRQVYGGAEGLRLRDDGALVIQTGLGELVEEAPVVYQEIGGRREEVEGGYLLLEDGQVGFALGAYDAAHPLVIDPTLTYSTYRGGSGSDIGYGIAVDSDGNAYVTGETASSNFTPTVGAYDPDCGTDGSCNGTTDAFVTKLNSAGSALTYSTYLGGSGSDSGRSITVDSSGNAYVTGHTNSSTDFPTPNAAQGTYGGGTTDVFVTKLNAAGSALTYSTYLGGSGTDIGYGIAVDTDANAYVTGVTASSNFITTTGAFQTANAGSNDAFVTKLTATGAISYSTYLGGSSNEAGNGIAVDSSSNAYVTGDTGSSGFPVTIGAADTSYNGGSTDAFVTKLNAAGSARDYSTFLGGSNDDSGRSIAVDSSGNAFVTGRTLSTGFPMAGAYDNSCGTDGNCNSGLSDAFVTKLNASGSTLTYSTYLGGSRADEANGIAIALAGSPGNAFVTGFTLSTDFPPVSPYQGTLSDSTDAFVTELKADGSGLMYSTYLGGGGDDFGYGIAVISTASAISALVTGSTDSDTFPMASALQGSRAGGSDAFVTRIPFSGPTAVILSSFTADSGQHISQVDLILATVSPWLLAGLAGIGLLARGVSILKFRG